MTVHYCSPLHLHTSSTNSRVEGMFLSVIRRMQKAVASFGNEFAHKTIMHSSWFFIITVTVMLDSSYGNPCRYWCKTHEDHYYCCPSGRPEELKHEEKWSLPNVWIHIISSIINWHSHEHVEHHESGHATSNSIESKLHCPPVRSICPRHWNFNAPKLCHSDKTCELWEKCCYDICLDQKVCKPAE